ncbi:hypothetical protein [Streptomyces sp. NPDC101237]|uniref:hypothetical protein n=1 Tax=Streptomyces sp. NPDC101237 TaxID=3366139 RepID=UPI00381A604F
MAGVRGSAPRPGRAGPGASAGNIGARARIEPFGHPLVPIEGRRLRDDFGSWSPRGHDAVPARPTGTHPRTPGGGRALAGRPATPLTGAGASAALLTGDFVRRAETVPGGRRHWREL